MPYDILQVHPDSVIGDEQLGSKNKFWFQNGDEQWLFKEARANTGEDWAEKIAAEIAHIVGIRCARVELAEFAGHSGCGTRSFAAEPNVSLFHGNEILAGQIVGYERYKRLHQSDHTLANVVTAVQRLLGPSAICDRILRLLAGYLVLDALICNTDRHHENWGFLIRIESADDGHYRALLEVAPSFDHASSLGRELADTRRADILHRNGIGQYARKGNGGIYLKTTDGKGPIPWLW